MKYALFVHISLHRKSKNKGGGTRTLLENQLFHNEPLGVC